jgi:hypothetical protein
MRESIGKDKILKEICHNLEIEVQMNVQKMHEADSRKFDALRAKA